MSDFKWEQLEAHVTHLARRIEKLERQNRLLDAEVRKSRAQLKELRKRAAERGVKYLFQGLNKIKSENIEF